MKVIGMLGGMSWESSLEYYRVMNEHVKEKLGGDRSAEIAMYSFDFRDIIRLQHEGRWEELEDMLVERGKSLRDIGADFLIICANTMHRMADEVEERVGLPLVHIGDATAEEIKSQGLSKVGLVGTKFVMDDDFYSGRLKEKHGIDVILPVEDDKSKVHDIIYNELCKGIQEEDSKEKLIKMMRRMQEEGAEGVILGCTEIPLFIDQKDIDIPLFDTTRIHARTAAEFSLSSDE